jgi:hypothetical protein
VLLTRLPELDLAIAATPLSDVAAAWERPTDQRIVFVP